MPYDCSQMEKLVSSVAPANNEAIEHVSARDISACVIYVTKIKFCLGLQPIDLNICSRQCTGYSECSRYHRNRFTFGGAIAERVWTPSKRAAYSFEQNKKELIGPGRSGCSLVLSLVCLSAEYQLQLNISTNLVGWNLSQLASRNPLQNSKSQQRP